jgi:hypothetical protein
MSTHALSQRIVVVDAPDSAMLYFKQVFIGALLIALHHDVCSSFWLISVSSSFTHE